MNPMFVALQVVEGVYKLTEETSFYISILQILTGEPELMIRNKKIVSADGKQFMTFLLEHKNHKCVQIFKIKGNVFKESSGACTCDNVDSLRLQNVMNHATLLSQKLTPNFTDCKFKNLPKSQSEVTEMVRKIDQEAVAIETRKQFLEDIFKESFVENGGGFRHAVQGAVALAAMVTIGVPAFRRVTRTPDKRMRSNSSNHYQAEIHGSSSNSNRNVTATPSSDTYHEYVTAGRIGPASQIPPLTFATVQLGVASQFDTTSEAKKECLIKKYQEGYAIRNLW